MHQQSTFARNHHADIQHLCAELAEHLGRPVVPEYGETDDGQFHDAALCLGDELCNPLVTIIAGLGSGDLGFAVMAANGSTVVRDVSFGDALRSARTTGAQEFRRIVRRTRRMYTGAKGTL